MALCESQLDSVLQINTDEQTSEKKMEPNGDIYGLDNVPPLPLSVDYRSPVSHFVPPAVELYAARHKPDLNVAPAQSETPTPIKRGRGRPRIDKTSPEYLANLAARKQAREMAAVMNSQVDSGEKRKRGRPRVDKTSPEYLARKRARELEALEKKAKREYRRRNTGGTVKTSNSMTSCVKINPPKIGNSIRQVPQRVPKRVPQKVSQNVQQKVPQKVSQRVAQRVPQNVPQKVPQKVPVRMDKKILYFDE